MKDKREFQNLIIGTRKSGKTYTYRTIRGSMHKFDGMVMDAFQLNVMIETVKEMDDLIKSLRIMKFSLINNGDPRNKVKKPDYSEPKDE